MLASLDHISGGRAGWKRGYFDLSQSWFEIWRLSVNAPRRSATLGARIIAAINYPSRGPLNIARPIQGRSVIAQAGSSAAGRASVARNICIAYTMRAEFKYAKEFYDDVKGRPRGMAVMRVPSIPGAAVSIADRCEKWMMSGAADGLNAQFSNDDDSLEIFVEEVIPEFQRRGLFQPEYRGITLRENLGLPRPVNRYAASADDERADRWKPGLAR